MGKGAMRSAAADLAAIDYGPGASILIFADDPERRSQLGAMVRAAGGRVSAALALAEAPARIEAHAAPDGVVAELDGECPALIETVLDALEMGARAHRFRSVALLPSRLIDLAMARGGHRDIALLCGEAGADLATALAALTSPRSLWLSDITADSGANRLRELSEQVGRIARALVVLSHREDGKVEPIETVGETVTVPDAPMLRAIIRSRRLRDQFFGSEIFADPAWDMLLDLMAARLEGQPVAVSSLCIAAAVPPTTALRWIKAMTDLGLFVRVADPRDRRRVFIEMAPRAVEAMTAYLAAARKANPPAL